MTATAEVFELHRPRLFGIACRMLGSRCEAEDLLQDAYLRWHEAKPANLQSVVGFLITITTRLCLDRLRKRKQEPLEGGLCEELLADAAPSPEMERESCEELSVALAVVFDRLGRDERTAFLLHEVFDYDYSQIAGMLGKAEPACRQIVHRARKRVREGGAFLTAMTESRQRLVGRFVDAVRSGDRRAALSLIDYDN